MMGIVLTGPFQAQIANSEYLGRSASTVRAVLLAICGGFAMLGAFLWFRADVFGGPEEAKENTNRLPFDAVGLRDALFSCVGLYFAVSGIAGLVEFGVDYLRIPRETRDLLVQAKSEWVYYVTTAVVGGAILYWTMFRRRQLHEEPEL